MVRSRAAARLLLSLAVCNRFEIVNYVCMSVDVVGKLCCVYLCLEAVSAETIAQRKSAVWSSLDESSRAVYGESYLDSMYNNLTASLSKLSADFSSVVTAMSSALLSKQPVARYTVGRGARMLLTVYSLLPTSLADRLASALSVVTGRDSRPAHLYK